MSQFMKRHALSTKIHIKIYTQINCFYLQYFIAHAQNKLNGICTSNNPDILVCNIKASLNGGMEIQINGEGFNGLPTDHKVSLEDAHSGSTTSGLTISNDDAFSSNIDRGRLVYTVPSINDILGNSESISTATRSNFNSYVSVENPTSAFHCDGDRSECIVNYNIAHTPIVNRVYPSTVYAGQSICFNVFTGNSNYLDGTVLSSVGIDGFKANVTYSNPESASTTGNHQL